MKIPEQYKDLSIDKKRVVVHNLLSWFWNEKAQETAKKFNEDQIEFLFTYFFTESKEEREKMWNDMQKKYESLLKELEQVADKLQTINLKLSELLAEREDIESFWKDRK